MAFRIWATARTQVYASRARVSISRRFQSDEARKNAIPSAPQGGPDKQSVTIPGPAWLWTSVQPFAAPFRAYGRASKNRPYVTQFFSSLVIYFLGDLASQYIRERGEHPESPGRGLVDNYDTQRPQRALCISALSSIPTYRWFIYLSLNFNVPATWPTSGMLSLIYKVAINQALFTPIFNSYFFGMQCILSGEGGPQKTDENVSTLELLAPVDRISAAWDRIVDTVPTSWYNSCKFWPFVTAFSFTFIPLRQRSIFAGFAAIGWQSYLGILNQRAVEQERRELTQQTIKM